MQSYLSQNNLSDNNNKQDRNFGKTYTSSDNLLTNGTTSEALVPNNIANSNR